MVDEGHNQQDAAGAGNVHILRPPGLLFGGDSARFSLRIENYACIRRAYGEDIARSALAGLLRVLTELFLADAVAEPEASSGGIDLLVWRGAALGDGSLPDAAQAWLDEFCWLVPQMSFETSAGPIHLWVSGRWQTADALSGRFEAGQSGVCDVKFLGDGPDGLSDWPERYRADMALAASLLPGIVDDESGDDPDRELALAWQPVRDATCADAVLWREARGRVLDLRGNVQSTDEMFLALERLGFVRVVDHQVVSRVVDELEAALDVVLAVKISARSLCDDAWWDQIKARLRARPDVARRLVLEIAEAVGKPGGISEAVRFVTGMRLLGCRIALVEFGTGYASIRELLTFAPDFVKIDSFFVRRLAMSPGARETLAHLIGLGHSLGTTVIVEGVDTQEQADLVLAAGGHWQQGDHWGGASLYRSWRLSGGDGSPILAAGPEGLPSDGGQATGGRESPWIWAGLPSDPDSELGDVPGVGLPFFKGLMFAVPLSLVLWAGLWAGGMALWKWIAHGVLSL